MQGAMAVLALNHHAGNNPFRPGFTRKRFDVRLATVKPVFAAVA
jgi:hypothetical protein